MTLLKGAGTGFEPPPIRAQSLTREWRNCWAQWLLPCPCVPFSLSQQPGDPHGSGPRLSRPWVPGDHALLWDAVLCLGLADAAALLLAEEASLEIPGTKPVSPMKSPLKLDLLLVSRKTSQKSPSVL